MILLAFFASFGFVLALFAGAYAGGAHKRLDELGQRVAKLEQCRRVDAVRPDLGEPMDFETAPDPFAIPKEGP